MVCTFIISSEGFYGQILTLFVLSTKWPFIFKCCAWSLSRLCLTLCDPMDCGPPDFSVHGILQTRILEWVAMHSSRASSQSRDQTQVSCIAGRFFTTWATREAHSSLSNHINRQRKAQTISQRCKVLVFYQNTTTINEKWENILLSRIWMLSLKMFGEDSGVGRGGVREKKNITEDLQNNFNEILQFLSLMEKRHHKVYTSLALSKGKKKQSPTIQKQTW